MEKGVHHNLAQQSTNHTPATLVPCSAPGQTGYIQYARDSRREIIQTAWNGGGRLRRQAEWTVYLLTKAKCEYNARAASG